MGSLKDTERGRLPQAHPTEEGAAVEDSIATAAARAARAEGVRAMPVKVFRRNVALGVAGVFALVTAGAGHIVSTVRMRQAREDLSGEWVHATGFSPDLAKKLIRMSPEEREQMLRLLSEAEEADPETIEAVLAMMEHGYKSLSQAQVSARLEFLMSPAGVALILEEFRGKVGQLTQDANLQDSLVSHLQQVLEGSDRREVVEKLQRGKTVKKGIELKDSKGVDYFQAFINVSEGNLIITFKRRVDRELGSRAISQITFSTAGLSENP